MIVRPAITGADLARSSATGLPRPLQQAMRRTVLILLIALPAICCWARPGICEWQRFNIADGLAGDNVYAILEDRAGNLWFSTLSGGVSRYDGASWRTFTTADGLASND